LANEISFTSSLTVNKPSIMSSAIARSVNNLLFSMNGNFTVEGTISVGTSATAIPLGQVTQPHWAFFNNLDPTNFLTLFNGVSGAVFAQLYAGECAFVPLAIACVPYALANTNPILLEYLIVSL
jgi:hypothetical protein